MLHFDTQFSLEASETMTSVDSRIEEVLRYNPELIMVITSTDSRRNGDL